MQKSLEYEIVGESGPSHEKRFNAEVRVDGIVFGSGNATTKKDAEQEAAKDALSKYKESEFK